MNKVRAYLRAVSGTINTDVDASRSYAGLYIASGTGGQAFSSSASQVTQWTSKMAENICSASFAGGRIDVSASGDYDVDFHATYSTQFPAHHVYEVYVSSSAAAPSGTFLKCEAVPILSGNLASVSCRGVLTLTNGQSLSVYGSVKSGSAVSATLIHSQFMAKRVK